MRDRDKQLINDVLLDYPDLRVFIRKGEWSTFWKEVEKISFGANSKPEYHDTYAIFILIFGELNIEAKIPKKFPIWSFYKQGNLGNIIIPEGVTVLGNSCFREATFDAISLPSTLKTIEYEVFKGSNLSKIVLPDNLTTIDAAAFYNSNLSKINLPSKLEFIGNGCFSKCNLSEITVPESVIILGDGGSCFYRMAGDKDIIINLPKKWSKKPSSVKTALGLRSDKPKRNKNQWVFNGEDTKLGYSITVNFY